MLMSPDAAIRHMPLIRCRHIFAAAYRRFDFLSPSILIIRRHYTLFMFAADAFR